MTKLKRIYIEISNICNVQCSFCPVVERDKQIMSLEEFEKTLLQARPLADEVCLHLMGEPLAHPQFLKILELCEKHEVLIQLTTNALLIKRYQDRLIDSPILRQINFSLQAYTDNFPHKPLAPYLESILDFCDEASVKAPAMYQNLRLWNLGADSGDNEKIMRILEQKYGMIINREVDVSSIKSKKVKNRLYLHFDSRFEWPDLKNENLGKQGRCHGLVSHVGIHANGVVVPCCLDKEAVIKLGNVFENKLIDILNSERASEMREGFQNGKLTEELCQKCSYIRRFKISS